MSTNTATISVRHLGGDRLRIETRGHEILADQPIDGGGDDTGVTPTELFLAGLAGCVAFYGARFLRRHGLTTEGLTVACNYTWADSPTRVGGIDLTVDAPGLTEERRVAFSRVVEHCTVHNTLRQPPEVRIRVATAQVAAAANGTTPDVFGTVESARDSARLRPRKSTLSTGLAER